MEKSWESVGVGRSSSCFPGLPRRNPLDYRTPYSRAGDTEEPGQCRDLKPTE